MASSHMQEGDTGGVSEHHGTISRDIDVDDRSIMDSQGYHNALLHTAAQSYDSAAEARVASRIFQIDEERTRGIWCSRPSEMGMRNQ